MRSFLVVGVLIAGCSSDAPGDTPPVANVGDTRPARQLSAEIRDDAGSIAAANSQFAFDLYGQLAAAPGNVVFSPFSISTALAMIDAGAQGTTDAELRAALHFSLPGARTHAAYGALLASLQVGRDHGAYDLATANRLFGQVGAAFEPDFQATTERVYGAALLPVDFANHTEDARGTINTWVADQTEQLVPELFARDDLDPATVLVLANAIAFKGAWADKFDASRTASEPFHLADGSTIQTRMMHRTGTFMEGRALPGAVVGVLPFDGHDLSMAIVLPFEADGLAAVEAELRTANIADLLGDGGRVEADLRQVEVAIPRFSLRSSYPLIDALRALGIVSAFDAQTANFAGIDGQRDLVFETMLHKAVISVDEEGAVAAAASAGGAVPVSLPAPFIVDRPFVFMIFDHVSKSILFLGRVSDPRVGQ